MLKIDNLKFVRDKQYCFNLEVPQGEMVCLYGQSGIGKSTLLSLIAGFEKSVSGELMFDNKRLHNLPVNLRPVSMLFQDNNVFPHFTGWQNIAIGIKQNLKLTEYQKKQIDQVAQKISIMDQLNKMPEQMSGGQIQRVALARCLLRNQPILLLDEPFSALDESMRLECMALLRTLQKENNWTVILVSHYPDEVRQFVDWDINCEEVLS